MKLKEKVLSMLVSVAMVFSLLPAGAFAADTETVTIFTTNDIHGVVAADDKDEGSIGMAQAAAMKASTTNSLLVDAGDAVQGASFATISQGEDVIKMMNAAGYDVMAAGNHEFDFGTDQLKKLEATAEFPILSANVMKDGATLLESSAVIEAGGKKIGFVGITTKNTATSTNPAKLTGVTFGDEIQAAKDEIAKLKDKTDAIVLITHLGDSEAAVSCTSKDLLNGLSEDELKEITAVIDGHSHTVEQNTYTKNGVSIPVVQTGTQFTSIGMVEITFGANSASAACKVLNKAEADEYSLNENGTAKKAEVENVLNGIQSEQKKILDEKLCVNDIPLWGDYICWDYAESRIVETAYGDFVTDAFAEYAREFAENNGIDLPVIAVENGGGIGQTLPAGTVTRGDVLNAFNHGNMVEVYEVTPQMLRKALEIGLKMTGQDETGMLVRKSVSGSFLQAGGFSYSYDPAGATGEKVVDITLADGTKLDLNDNETKLLLATNNYVGTFNGIKDGTKVGELGGEDQIVMDYILANLKSGRLNYEITEPRIIIANDQSPETYTVTIPVQLEDKTAIPDTDFMISIDGEEGITVTTNENGEIVLELEKGAHTIWLKEAKNVNKPVYVNNYSGSGTVTTREGYYTFGFTALSIEEYRAEVAQQIEDYAARNISDINEYLTYCKEDVAELAITRTEYLRDFALEKLADYNTYEEIGELYDEFVDGAEIMYEVAALNDTVEYYKAETEDHVKDGTLTREEADALIKKLEGIERDALENIKNLPAEGIIDKSFEILDAAFDDIDKALVEANKDIVKDQAAEYKDYFQKAVDDNPEWFEYAPEGKVDEVLNDIITKLDDLLKEYETSTNLDEQIKLYDDTINGILSEWAELNTLCAKARISEVTQNVTDIIKEAEEIDGKDRSDMKAAIEALKAEAEKTVDALDDEDTVVKGNIAVEVMDAYIEVVDNFRTDVSAEYLEAFLVGVEKQYAEDIDNFTMLTDEERAQYKKDVKEAIKSVRDEIATKTKAEIKENIKKYEGTVNLAYTKPLATSIVRNAKATVEGLDYVTEEEKAEVSKLIEDNYAAVQKIIAENDVLNWEKTDELLGEIEDKSDDLWRKDVFLWVDKYALEEYDAAIKEFGPKCTYINQEQFEELRNYLKFATAIASVGMKLAVGTDDEVEKMNYYGEKLQDMYDSTIFALFQSNAMYGINSAADETIDAIKALEEKDGTDLSELTAAIEKLQEEAENALLGVETEFAFISDMDAVAALYDEIANIGAEYEAKIRAVLPETEPEKQPEQQPEQTPSEDPGKSPETGFDTSAIAVLIALSGCLTVILAKKRSRSR